MYAWELRPVEIKTMIAPETQHNIRNATASIEACLLRIEKEIMPNGLNIVSPVGHWNIRNDSEGFGGFTAKRGNRTHSKNDLLCVPGQEIVAPFNGVVLRHYPVYEDLPHYEGVEILSDNNFWIAQISYIVKLEGLDAKVESGQHIAFAADIRGRYSPEMKAHIDFRVTANPVLFGDKN